MDTAHLTETDFSVAFERLRDACREDGFDCFFGLTKVCGPFCIDLYVYKMRRWLCFLDKNLCKRKIVAAIVAIKFGACGGTGVQLEIYRHTRPVRNLIANDIGPLLPDLINGVKYETCHRRFSGSLNIRSIATPVSLDAWASNHLDIPSV